MNMALHIPFSSFTLAFKSTDTPNVYQCMTFGGFATSNAQYLPENGVIVLKQAPGTEDLPLPSPVLLDCHYRLAEILNASGMGNVIDEHWRRWGELKATVQHTLQPNGDSDLGNLLRTALWHRVRT
ncbi:uncharacterized protein AKAW2_81365S [Aspergillus luchuensis]|uniref:Uncharacterized protein n=1 Tax=Aspergillus kawachii TaxID=1069201 RepID=A0A7R7WN89_ASPKA|nr:uncharacterized protein AKAW2_81365S [Aspergillus luchuensis]BCS05564.1 hypothetical protein AKAW2_81365S [Aspergillus luchuensis]